MSLWDDLKFGAALFVSIAIVLGIIGGITYGIVTVAKWAWSG